MDAFFASVEQRDHSEYRGKPVIVGSPQNQRGVVCAASYEARKFKVRSAMPSRTAGKLCPHGIFVRPRMDAYRAESIAITEILRCVTPVIERVSVDEAYLDLSDHFRDHDDTNDGLEAAVPVAREIKRRITAERNLTASFGVAANKFLAKLGSDFQKPDGLTLIRAGCRAEPALLRVVAQPLFMRSVVESERTGVGTEFGGEIALLGGLRSDCATEQRDQ
jgi:DNA polymerase-4